LVTTTLASPAWTGASYYKSVSVQDLCLIEGLCPGTRDQGTYLADENGLLGRNDKYPPFTFTADDFLSLGSDSHEFESVKGDSIGYRCRISSIERSELRVTRCERERTSDDVNNRRSEMRLRVKYAMRSYGASVGLVRFVNGEGMRVVSVCMDICGDRIATIRAR
jgi:hypothetical protein